MGGFFILKGMLLVFMLCYKYYDNMSFIGGWLTRTTLVALLTEACLILLSVSFFSPWKEGSSPYRTYLILFL